MTAERTVIRQRAHPHSAGAIAARARGEQIIGYVNPDPAGRGEGNWSARLQLSSSDADALEATCSLCEREPAVLVLPDGFGLGAACKARQDARYDQETGFHEACSYAWRLHDNTRAGRPQPFGCPSESEARAAWGDR